MNTFIHGQQKFSDNYIKFVHEYFKLLTQYYHNWSNTSIFCTYYSFDLENSLGDEKKLVNGAFESVGELSGWRWRKILNFQIDNVEPLSTNVTADEKGVTSSDKMTTMRIAGNDFVECHAHDFLYFSCLQDDSNYKLRNPPLFEITNVEKSPDFDQTFYKVNAKITFIPVTELDKQVDGLFDMVDYEKKIYGIDDSLCIQQILDNTPKHQCNKFYNQNTGLYFDTVSLV